MILPFNWRQYKRIIQEEYSLVIAFFLIIIIFLLLIYVIRIRLDLITRSHGLENEVAILKNRVITIKNSQNYIEKDVEQTNRFLSLLIPDFEDFFSIIKALEKISEVSGFAIKGYDVNLQRTVTEKLSLIVEGSGNDATFIDFLKNYNFAGGRFVTSGKIEYTDSPFKTTKIHLDFYSKKVVIDNSGFPQLTKEDFTFINKIKEKVKITFTEKNNQGESLPLDYAINPKPF